MRWDDDDDFYAVDYGMQVSVSFNEFAMSKRNLCLITHCRCLREAKLEILKYFTFYNYCRYLYDLFDFHTRIKSK